MKSSVSEITSFKLPPELFKAMQYIHDNFSDISFSIKSKLNFLASNLLNQFGSESEKNKYDSLIVNTGKIMKPEEELIEFAQIKDLSPEIASKIYVDTVSILFPSSQLILSSVIKKATLYVRSQTLKIWGERIMELNFGRKIFIIQRSSPKKPDKVLDLMTYELKWFGDVRGRICFGLDSKNPKNHYKSFCIGSDKLEIAKDWFECIRWSIAGCYISSFIEQQNKKDKLVKKQRRTQDDIHLNSNQVQQNSNPSSNPLNNKTAKTFKQIKEEFEKKKIDRETNNDNNKMLKKNSQSFSESTYPGLYTEDLQQRKNSNSVVQTQTAITQEYHPEIDKITKSLSLGPFNDFFHLEESIVENEKKGARSPNFKMLEYEKKLDGTIPSFSSFSFSMVSNGPDKKIIKENIETTQKDILVDNSINFENQKVFKKEKLKQKTTPNNLQNNDSKKYKLKKKIFKLKSSDHYLKKFNNQMKKNKNLFTYIPSSQNICNDEMELVYRNKANIKLDKHQIYFSKNFELNMNLKINFSNLYSHLKFKTIKNEENLMLMQHKSKKNRFKLFLTLPFNFRLILHYIIEPKHLKEYNKSVSEFKFLNSRNASENLLLTALKLKIKNGKTFDFYFSRYFFENNDYFIINDNSLDFFSDDVNGISNNSKDCINYFIVIKKKQEIFENNLVFDICFKDKSILKQTEIINSFLIYFQSFFKMKEFFDQKICSLMKNFQSNEKACQERIELKHFYIDKFLISNQKKLSKRRENSPNLFSPKVAMKNKNRSLSLQKFTDKIVSKTKIEKNEKELEKENIINNFLISKKQINFNNNSELLYFANQLKKTPKSLMNSEKWEKMISKHNFLQSQRDYIYHIKLQQLEKLKRGLNIFKLILPEQSYSKETCIEKIAKAFRFAPLYLNNAQSNPLEKIQGVTNFLVLMLNDLISPLIPFPNINGETFQAKINNENLIYFEVIKEKIFLYFVGKKFKIWGHITPNFKLFSNEFVLGYDFHLIFTFSDLTKIKVLEMPLLKCYDNAEGKRIFSYEGKSLIYDENNELLSELLFNGNDADKIMFSFSQKHITNLNEYSGWIKCVKKEHMQHVICKMNNFKKIRMNKEIKKICRIEGDILNFLSFNKNNYWEAQNKCDVDFEIGNYILPSDCILREDVLCFKIGKYDKARFLKNNRKSFF